MNAVRKFAVLLLAGALLYACARPAFTPQSLPELADFEADLQGDQGRLAVLFHSYEVSPGPDTPPPSGYKPCYISHYSRHGSRRQYGSGGVGAFELLKEAFSKDLLTPEGAALMAELEPLARCHKDMDGELTLRGGMEHQGIARRMYKRFKPVFRSGQKVHGKSSTFRRCITSMANFGGALWSEAPGLEVDFQSGDKYSELFLHPYLFDVHADERFKANQDSLFYVHVDPVPIVNRFFKQGAEVPSPMDFVMDFFYVAAGAEDLVEEVGELDIFKYLTREEQLGLSKFFNEKYYMTFCNSELFGDCTNWSAQWMLNDIVSCADAALSGGDVAADIRFGHDSALLPLVNLIGLDPMCRRYKVGEAWKHGWYIWRWVCMGSNLQMVFYRNSSSDVLVKFLFNEKEVLLPALQNAPYAPYYKWSELRPYLVSLCPDVGRS